jgi:thiol-disulfide isomerase/thioredoxin
LLIALLACALVVAVIGGWMLSRDPEPSYTLDDTLGSIALNKVSEGRMLPVVDLQDINDNMTSTDLWQGQRLIINFWFSTCEPCRREFPVLVAADAQLASFRIVGVNLSDSSAIAVDFMQKYGATFDTYFDRDGRLTSALGIATAPVTLLVDEGGLVRKQLTGEITETMLTAALAEAFPT